MKIYNQVLAALERCTDPNDAGLLGHFFKTGEGQYSAGDQFIGTRVPAIRLVAREYVTLSLGEIEELLESPIHEMRLCALLVMTLQYPKANDAVQQALYDLYLRRTDRINNWDLVDASCRTIVGQYVLDHPKAAATLRQLALSDSLWERRIAMVSTWQLIRQRQLDLTFEIAAMLLNDKQDLIYKAVGWMLREAGKRDELELRTFLAEHRKRLPRTALRYAIEKFSPEDRAEFMKR